MSVGAQSRGPFSNSFVGRANTAATLSQPLKSSDLDKYGKRCLHATSAHRNLVSGVAHAVRSVSITFYLNSDRYYVYTCIICFGQCFHVAMLRVLRPPSLRGPAFNSSDWTTEVDESV